MYKMLVKGKARQTASVPVHPQFKEFRKQPFGKTVESLQQRGTFAKTSHTKCNNCQIHYHHSNWNLIIVVNAVHVVLFLIACIVSF